MIFLATLRAMRLPARLAIFFAIQTAMITSIHVKITPRMTPMITQAAMKMTTLYRAVCEMGMIFFLSGPLCIITSRSEYGIRTREAGTWRFSRPLH